MYYELYIDVFFLENFMAMPIIPPMPPIIPPIRTMS